MGEEKMNMPTSITGDNIHFTYEQVDLEDLDPDGGTIYIDHIQS
jgi:hypothetical protein